MERYQMWHIFRDKVKDGEWGLEFSIARANNYLQQP